MTTQTMSRSPEVATVRNWLSRERIGWCLAIVFFSAVSFSVGNGHTTQNAIADVSTKLGQTKAKLDTVQTKVVPALKAEAAKVPELKRENVELRQAITSSDSAPDDDAGKPQ